MSDITFYKDPEAVLDYGVDWSSWLTDSETISSSSWTVPSGITEDSNTSSDTKATIWLSGGTDGESYKLINHIITSAGREEDQTMWIVVKEK